MRVVLIATDERDADAWVEMQPHIELVEVLWVSPRSPGRARAVTADAVLITDDAADLPRDVLARLLEGTLPCVQSGGTS